MAFINSYESFVKFEEENINFDFNSVGIQSKHSKFVAKIWHPNVIASYTLLGLESLFGIETTIFVLYKPK